MAWNPFARKEQPKKAKRFAAAQHPRLLKNFTGGSLSIDERLKRDLAGLRELSRKQGEDSGYVHRYFTMVQTHIVGDKGIRLQNQARKANGKIDERANKAVQQAWLAFSKFGVAEVTGRHSMISAQELIIKTIAQDGDIIIRHIDGADNEFGYAFQILESDMLDIGMNRQLKNGYRIKSGVETDSWGKPVAYHLFTNHPGDFSYTIQGQKYIRVPADEIMLPFPQWRPGQTRGIPWPHASLLDMHEISGFRESVLVGAQVGASNMMIYERDPELEPSESEDGAWSDEGEFIVDLEAGTAAITPEGYRARESNFQMPDAGVGEFTKSVLRGSASGMDVNYNVLGNDYEGVNFSSLRQAVLEDRDHWKRKQRFAIEQVMEPIFHRWIKNALLHGAIQGYSADQLRRLDQPIFRGRRWNWVDPLKDEQAVGEAMSNFTINPMDVLNDKGVDLEEMHDGYDQFLNKMESVMKRANAFGIGKAAPPAPEQEQKQEQPEAEQ